AEEDHAEAGYEEEEEEEEEEYEPQPVATSEDAETAREFLERMLDSLEFPNVVTVRNVEQEKDSTSIHLDVAGDDVGLLIGRHGDTLSSLQFLVNACVGRSLPRNTRVIVDIE